jgi:SAM-dependent methyltransferase
MTDIHSASPSPAAPLPEHVGALPIEALFNAAQAAIDAGRQDEAIRLYTAWLEQSDSPLRYAARFNLAVSLAASGDAASAEREYRRVLDEQPGFAPARQNLVALLEQTGRPDEAQLLRLAPEVDAIPIVTVSYNSPDLIAALLASIRRFYPNPVYVIDGSHPDVAAQIRPVAEQYPDVRFIPFGYNIHHGPGMTWAIRNLGLHGPVLFLDSDVEVLRRGFLESLRTALRPGMYGVGSLQYVNALGQPVEQDGYLYLHPACMLCDIDVMRQWPLPIKHGAPMMPSMVAMHDAGRSDLIGNVAWVQNDFGQNPDRIFIRHDWQGTVIRTGGYHYDKPVATQQVDEQLLALVPVTPVKVVEAGCGDGSFAKAYKARNPLCDYTGIEPDAALAAQARPHCDYVFNEPVEQDGAERQVATAGADCWIARDVLGRLEDPAAWLAQVRSRMAPGATLVLSEPNAQHWRNQVLLNQGTPAAGARHPFTRTLLLDLLARAGFTVASGGGRVVDEPERERYLPALRALAQVHGGDGEQALQDALPLHYLIVASAA